MTTYTEQSLHNLAGFKKKYIFIYLEKESLMKI